MNRGQARRAVTWAGRTFDVSGNPDDPYFQTIGGFDPIFEEALRRVPSDGVVFDIGANIGVTALAAASQAASVHAFEPDGVARGFLEHNLAQNGAENVTVHPLAVGHEVGRLPFFSDTISKSASHLVSDATLDHVSEQSVEVTTLDVFTAASDIPRIDLIKVDIEGFEIDVLRGAPKTLSRYRPRMLIEFNAFTMVVFRNITPRDLLDVIRSTFPRVERMRSLPGGAPLEPIVTDHDALHFIHDNLVKEGCVDDLLCSFE